MTGNVVQQLTNSSQPNPSSRTNQHGVSGAQVIHPPAVLAVLSGLANDEGVAPGGELHVGRRQRKEGDLLLGPVCQLGIGCVAGVVVRGRTVREDAGGRAPGLERSAKVYPSTPCRRQKPAAKHVRFSRTWVGVRNALRLNAGCAQVALRRWQWAAHLAGAQPDAWGQQEAPDNNSARQATVGKAACACVCACARGDMP